MEGAAFHYDHLHKRKCYGYSIVTSGYAKKNQFIPFRCEVYQRKERLAPGSRFMTKNELVLQILEEALLFQRFRYVVVDAWYTNKIILRFLYEHKQFFIGDLKCNRNVTIGKRKKAVADHCFITKMQKYVIGDQLYRAYAEDAYLPALRQLVVSIQEDLALTQATLKAVLAYLYTGGSGAGPATQSFAQLQQELELRLAQGRSLVEKIDANESKDLIFEDVQKFATDVEQTTLALKDALTNL